MAVFTLGACPMTPGRHFETATWSPFRMSTDANANAKPSPLPLPATPPAAAMAHKGMKIFTYPKIIFIWPTMLVAMLCCIGMAVLQDRTEDFTKGLHAKSEFTKTLTESKTGPDNKTEVTTTVTEAKKGADGKIEVKRTVTDAKGKATVTNSTNPRRFTSPHNVMAILFLTVFALNILVMAIDFPRFTVIALIFAAVALTFFLLWLSSWLDVVRPLVLALENIFAFASSGFYLLISLAIFFNLGIIWFARYLDYWEILPNEILHNHGPFSDLERFPTTNLKFDKEIPDILEYLLLRSGRLVLHVQNERKAIVLDNVLWIDHKEAHLKKLMSRMEVRVTTDQEAAAEAP